MSDDIQFGETVERPDELETPGISQDYQPPDPVLSILGTIQANMLPDVSLQVIGHTVLLDTIRQHQQFNDAALFSNVDFKAMVTSGAAVTGLANEFRIRIHPVTTVSADTLLQQLPTVEVCTVLALEDVLMKNKRKMVLGTLRMLVSVVENDRLEFRIIYVEDVRNG